MAQGAAQVVRDRVREGFEVLVRCLQLRRVPPHPLVDFLVQLADYLLGPLALGDVAGGGEHANDLSRLVPIHRRVVKHRRHISVAVPNLQLVVLDQAFSEHLLVSRSGLSGVAKIICKVGPHELLTREAGHLLSGLVHVGDLSVRIDGQQRIETGFEQAAVISAGPAHGLDRPLQLRDIPRRCTDTNHLPRIVPIHRRAVKHRRHMSVAAPNLQPVVLDQAFSEHLLVSRSGPPGVGKIICKVGPNELLAREAGHLLSGVVHIGDLSVRSDGKERIQARLDQAAVVNACLARGLVGKMAFNGVSARCLLLHFAWKTAAGGG